MNNRLINPFIFFIFLLFFQQIATASTDLRLTKNVDKLSVTPNNTVTFTITVEWVGGNQSSRATTVEDVLPPEFIFDRVENTINASCVNAGQTITCQSPDIDNTTPMSFDIVATAGTTLGDFTNTATITYMQSQNEDDTNDADSVTVTIKTPTFSSGLRDFSLRNPADTRNVQGDISVIGNTVLCLSRFTNGFPNDNPDDPTFVCNPSVGINDVSNDYATKYIDVDGGGNETFNSSGATLALPPGSNVIWAGLYWQGFLHECQTSGGTGFEGARDFCRFQGIPSNVAVPSDNVDLSTNSYGTETIQLDIPNLPSSGTYTEITADSIDYYYNSGAEGTVYSAFADITNELNATFADGEYIAANLKSMEGEHGYGNFAAWSLFVIYEDPNGQFHNNSVYDGFQSIRNTTVSIPVSGFYTPTSGTVNSRLLLFAGEGENYYYNDYVQVGSGANYVTNTNNPINNVFNSTLSGFASDPSLTNNNGIDIDSFDTSSFMYNGQTSTTITIGSVGRVSPFTSVNGPDAIYPSVIAFSTELYQPNVCYMHTIYDQAGNEIGPSSTLGVGDTIRVVGYVMNDDNETAQRVKVGMTFDSTQLLYENDSSLLGAYNGDETTLTSVTDALDADNADFNVTNSDTLDFFVGNGATPSLGGTLYPSDSTWFQFDSTIQTDGNISLVYNLSFYNPVTGVSVDGARLPRCSGDDTTFSVIFMTVPGGMNVVNGYVPLNGTDPLDTNDSRNALYTQVSGQPFNATVVHLEDDMETVATWGTGAVLVELVGADNITDDASCEAAPLLYNYGGFEFNDASSVTPTFTYNKAHKNTTFRMHYYDFEGSRLEIIGHCVVSNRSANINGVPQCLNSDPVFLQGYFPECSTIATDPAMREVCNSDTQTGPDDWRCYQCITGYYGSTTCARDNFAIRPATYSLDINSTTLRAGNFYSGTITAKTATNADALDYNATININPHYLDSNVTSQLQIPSGCSITPNPATLYDPFGISVAFDQYGVASLVSRFKQDDVGNYRYKAMDKKWASDVDYSGGRTDCILGSSTNTPSSGKVGCIVEGEQIFSFIPDHFDVNLTLQDANTASDFTYVGDDANMSAQMNINIRALNAASVITSNYTANCYSDDVNFTVGLVNDLNISNATGNYIAGTGVSDTALNRIMFFSADNNTSVIRTQANPAVFDSNQSMFTNGVASVSMKLNFDKDITVVHNPFTRAISNFTYAVENNASTVFGGVGAYTDMNATFYFGRVHAPRYRINGNSGDVSLYYEIYCDPSAATNPCVMSDHTNVIPNRVLSVDDIRWYQNTNHLAANGSVNAGAITQRSGNEIIETPIGFSGATQVWNFTYDESRGYPFKSTMLISVPEWLLYNKYDSTVTTNSFELEFNAGGGNWGGVDRSGVAVDSNASRNTNRRIEW